MSRRCGVAAGSRIVIAVSGGADSVALLAALADAGYECLAAHCNFHLRGEESQRDMHHVEDVADRLGIDLYIKNFDVHGRMALTGESVEMACRSLRYEWFHDLLERTRATAIAVGHHREDQVETFMLNLLRGTGIAGLTGMAPRNGLVVRPLLDMSRAEIEDYLAARGLSFVNDSSNSSDAYRRNKLRNIILPALESAFPGACDSILNTMSNLADNYGLYSYAVAELGRRFSDNDGARIDVGALAAAMPGGTAFTLLFEILRERGFNSTQTRNILTAAADSHSGTTRYDSGRYVGELKNGILDIIPADGAVLPVGEYRISLRQPVVSPVRIDISEHHLSEFAPQRDNAVMYLDIRALEGSPTFTLRHWHRGDRMRPFGMEGEKLLSDIFSDAGLSASAKRSVWLLTRDGVILWAVGLRASAHFAVRPGTRRYLRLSLKE